MADERLAVKKRLPRRGNPDNDIPLSGKSAEEDLEPGKERREEGASLCRAEASELLRDLGVDKKSRRGAVIGFQGPSGTVERKFQRRDRFSELRRPPEFRFLVLG